MLLRRICFSASRTHQNPVFISPVFANPFANSNSYPIFSSNFKSRTLGFQRLVSLNSRNIVSESTIDSTMERPRKPPQIPDTAGRAELFRALEASLGTAFSSQPVIPNPSPLVIVISGPSGAGKDAVIKGLREVREDIHFVVTATTRPMRQGEVDGKDYYFMDKEKFLELIDKDELLEYAMVYGDYKGIPKQQIREYMAKGFDIVLRVDIQGAATLRSILKNSGVFVFVVAESEEALVKRLIDRKTESTGSLVMRVAAAREELRHLKEFDYVVVNREGELKESVRLLESIIDAEKAKVRQRRAVI